MDINEILIEHSKKLLISCAVDHYTSSSDSFYNKAVVFKTKENKLHSADLTEGISNTAEILLKSETFRKQLSVLSVRGGDDPHKYYEDIAFSMVLHAFGGYLRSQECEWYSIAAESWVATLPDPMPPEQLQQIQARGVSSIDGRYEALVILNIKNTDPAKGSLSIYSIIKNSEGAFSSLYKIGEEFWDGSGPKAVQGRLTDLLIYKEGEEYKEFEDVGKTLIESMLHIVEVPLNV